MITILLQKILAALTSLMTGFTSDLATIKSKLEGISSLIIRNILSVDSDTVEYNTDLEEKFCKLKVTFSPIQSGTGDPSPTNVRAITGYTGLKVGNYSVDTSDITSIQLIEVDWTTEAGTVYGGSLDLISGVLTINFSDLVDLGDLAWSTDGQGYAQTNVSDIKPNPSTTTLSNIICDKLKTDTQAHVYQKYENNTISGATSAQVRLYSTSLNGMTAAQIKTALTGYKIAYELETPVTIQLTPEEVTTIKRTASLKETGISTNSSYTLTNINVDNIELCYFETVNNYFKNKEA